MQEKGIQPAFSILTKDFLLAAGFLPLAHTVSACYVGQNVQGQISQLNTELARPQSPEW